MDALLVLNHIAHSARGAGEGECLLTLTETAPPWQHPLMGDIEELVDDFGIL